MMLRSLPSFTTRALPNGIVKSGPGFSERLYGCRYRCLCSRNITGSSERIAVRNNPATSSAVEGITTRNPGQCVKRSEEHTSELQSRLHLVCRLLLEKNDGGPGRRHRARHVRHR